MLEKKKKKCCWFLVLQVQRCWSYSKKSWQLSVCIKDCEEWRKGACALDKLKFKQKPPPHALLAQSRAGGIHFWEYTVLFFLKEIAISLPSFFQHRREQDCVFKIWGSNILCCYSLCNTDMGSADKACMMTNCSLVPHVDLQLNRIRSLTSGCCVYSNIYNLHNICWVRYLTVVDPILSTSSAVHAYHHLTSGSVEIPLCFITMNSSSIGKEPAPSYRLMRLLTKG